MKINKNSLVTRVRNLSREKQINANHLYARYFFDCFLARLAKSKYSDHFILKGGLYLSSILGIESRTTVDLDFLLQKTKIEHDNVIKIVKDICCLSSNDDVAFSYISDTEIKKEDIFRGFSVTLTGCLENIKQNFDIDIVFGDLCYPHNIDYDYECLFTKEHLSIKGYSIESVMSEKLQAFLSLGLANSRSKDMYDLYRLYKEKINASRKRILKNAYKVVCEQRNFHINKGEAIEIFSKIKVDKIIMSRWNTYSKRVYYAKDIVFDDLMSSIEEIINVVYQ